MELKDYSNLSIKELINLLHQRDELIKKLYEDCQDAENCSANSLCLNQIVPKNSNGTDKLDLSSIKRYSRQLILPELGPKGQIKLQQTSVLIVGCGGLGCPSAIYLGAAGIGTLGLVDFDQIEISNLHRQVLHTEDRIGMSKAKSIAKSINSLNSEVKCIVYEIAIDSSTIMEIVNEYDIVLDCTDNVATRYLLNDACVFAKRPLVSGSALRFEGQLTVYSYEDGPCYRCLFPKPPPPETVTNCSDGGVLGAIPGTIGCLQAIEAMKIAANFGDVCSKKMILFDGLTMTIRCIKLRGKKESCDICGSSPTILNLIDYVQFCGAAATDKDRPSALLQSSARISVHDYKTLIDDEVPHLLIDVRSPIEMEICSLPNALNIPLKQLHLDSSRSLIENKIEQNSTSRIICVCRKGNDSQRAVLFLKDFCPDVRDIIGGLTAWTEYIDQSFPIY